MVFSAEEATDEDRERNSQMSSKHARQLGGQEGSLGCTKVETKDFKKAAKVGSIAGMPLVCAIARGRDAPVTRKQT
jgi:hypothetical protein